MRVDDPLKILKLEFHGVIHPFHAGSYIYNVLDLAKLEIAYQGRNTHNLVFVVIKKLVTHNS